MTGMDHKEGTSFTPFMWEHENKGISPALQHLQTPP